METLTLQKGGLETPIVQESGLVQSLASGQLATQQIEVHAFPSSEDDPQPVDEACAVGAAALAGEDAHLAGPAQQIQQERRYGYREDSPPEVIALLHEAQAGDTAAFAELYRLHADRVTRYVTSRMWEENRDAVPDVVQEAFCEALVDLGNAHTDVKGWLLAHAAKAYIRFVRADRKQERVVRSAREDVRREYAYGHSREQRYGGSGTVVAIGRISLVQALARLVPNQRRCIQHRYLEGQMQITTAGLMGKSLKAVKSAEHRALVKLRGELAGTAVSA